MGVQYLATDKHTSDLLHLIKSFTLAPKDFETNLRTYFVISEEEAAKQEAAKAIVVSADRIKSEQEAAKAEIQKAKDELNQKFKEHESAVAELQNNRNNHAEATKSLNDKVKKHEEEVNKLAAHKADVENVYTRAQERYAEIAQLADQLDKRNKELNAREDSIKQYENKLREKAAKLKEQFADI